MISHHCGDLDGEESIEFTLVTLEYLAHAFFSLVVASRKRCYLHASWPYLREDNDEIALFVACDGKTQRYRQSAGDGRE